jgi:hypothetical protein
MNDVDLLHARAVELAQRLASGAGRADTDALFSEIETLQKQTTMHSRKYPAPFDMKGPIDRLETTARELARYYRESSGAPR